MQYSFSNCKVKGLQNRYVSFYVYASKIFSANTNLITPLSI